MPGATSLREVSSLPPNCWEINRLGDSRNGNRCSLPQSLSFAADSGQRGFGQCDLWRGVTPVAQNVNQWLLIVAAKSIFSSGLNVPRLLQYFIPSRIGVINAFKLGNFEAHHLSGGLAHKFLLALAVGVFGYYFARHLGVLLIGDGVDGEKLNLLVI